MASSNHTGPVTTGQDTGAPATTTLGTLVAEQRATVSNTTSGASSIVLPDCTIKDITLDVLVSASGNAGGMLVRVGTTADATKYANLNSSAAGRYRLGVAPNVAAGSAAAMETVSGPQRLFIDVTAQTSATQTDAYSAIVSITYVQQ